MSDLFPKIKNEFVTLSGPFLLVNGIFQYIGLIIFKDEEKGNWILNLILGFSFAYIVLHDFDRYDAPWILFYLLGSTVFSSAASLLIPYLLMLVVLPDMFAEIALSKMVESPDPHNLGHRLLHALVGLPLLGIALFVGLGVLFGRGSDCGVPRGVC